MIICPLLWEVVYMTPPSGHKEAATPRYMCNAATTSQTTQCATAAATSTDFKLDADSGWCA